MKRQFAFYGTMALTLAIGVWIGQGVKAENTFTPGSADDPIVTKSYVDAKVASVANQTPTPQQPQPGNSTTPIVGIDTFKVVTINPGQSLKGGEGTEIIVRAGEVTVIASANGGVSDVTGGIDLAQGTKVQPNHLLLIPREDGRGIKAGGGGVTFLMVRGKYTVE
jgi:hypothetical protein